MTSQNNRELEEGAAQRHGVFSRTDARQSGVTEPTLAYRTSTGRYIRLHPGVFAIAGSPQSVRQRIISAVLSFPALAAASHQTAAEMWGLTQRGITTVEIVTTRWDRVHRPDVKVHESLDLLDQDVVELDGIPVTTPVRTIVDLGASNRWIVESALEQGIRRGLFTLSQVEELVARVGRRGRRGVGVIRPLLDARRQWDTATESALEDEFRKTLSKRGLPVPQTQFVVRNSSGRFVCRADFAYPAERILIELDSEAHHLDRIAFRRDRSKQNSAVMLGWTVLRYTWWDVQDRSEQMCLEIHTALQQAT